MSRCMLTLLIFSLLSWGHTAWAKTKTPISKLVHLANESLYKQTLARIDRELALDGITTQERAQLLQLKAFAYLLGGQHKSAEAVFSQALQYDRNVRVLGELNATGKEYFSRWRKAWEAKHPLSPTPLQKPNYLGPGIVMGVGGAFLVVGITTGILSLQAGARYHEATQKSNSTRTATLDDILAHYQTANTTGAVSLVTLGVSGVLLGGAILWFVMEAQKKTPPTQTKVSSQISGAPAILGRFF